MHDDDSKVGTLPLVSFVPSNILIDGDVVTKKMRICPSYKVFEREVYWLKYLNEKGYDWCPKLISYDSEKQIIQMSYVGEPISKYNAPKNWRQQLIDILTDLRNENIRHNDIKPTEVLVKDEKLYLIDYGWHQEVMIGAVGEWPIIDPNHVINIVIIEPLVEYIYLCKRWELGSCFLFSERDLVVN